ASSELSRDRGGIWFRLSLSIWASDNCAANIRGCDRGCAKLGSRSSCSDERFLGRCCGLVPWSWIIVRVFKAKSGGYSKVNGSTQFFPRGAPLPSTHSQKSKKQHTKRGSVSTSLPRRRGDRRKRDHYADRPAPTSWWLRPRLLPKTSVRWHREQMAVVCIMAGNQLPSV